MFIHFFNDGIAKLEQVIYGYCLEAEFLLSFVSTISTNERAGMTKRAFAAKEYGESFQQEIDNKIRVFRTLKKLTKINTFQTITRIKFMKSRAREMSISLAQARLNVNLALDRYSQTVEMSLT